MPETLAQVLKVYEGSDGDATRALYECLQSLGPAGRIATNLFRAQKTSSRAKGYRGRRYRDASYDTKQWLMYLVLLLREYAEGCGVRWGWGLDEQQPFHKHVLYVDLPTGQVSFHSDRRGEGPDYPAKWDGMQGQAADRIIRWCVRLLDAEAVAA